MKLKRNLCFLTMLFSMVIIFMLPGKAQAADIQYTGNLIPAMTSDTSPTGVVKASSYHANYYPYKAFNRSMEYQDMWMSNGSKEWLEYDFPDKQCITKYTIRAEDVSAAYNSPKNWTFEAYDSAKGQWVVLDTRENISSWRKYELKEFTFQNNNFYNNYRLNITSAVNKDWSIIICEVEMMSSITPTPTPTPVKISAPTNLTATPGNTKVDLQWDAVTGAAIYNIKRSETSGGPYTTISSVTGPAISYTDNKVVNGKTYYYVVNAVSSGTESPNSKEVSASPKAPAKKMKLVLEVNEKKQLSVSDDLSDNADMTWTSSDPSIVTVDSNGMAKAMKPGNTVITVTSKDKSYTETINVLVVDLDLQLAVDLNVGEKCRLTVDDLASNANVTWTAYDPAIATVTNKGKVTAVSEGLTYISAIDDQGKEVGRIYIRVRK